MTKLQLLIQENNLTTYRVSKDTGIPHNTILYLAEGKREINKVQSGTLYKLSNYFMD